jgi:ABC-type lipoprotein release transport system permease subunit
MSLLFRLAFRNIFRQRRRSLLTALSIGGGYILCALSLSLLEGSYNNLIQLFTLSNTGHIQIHQGNYLERPKVHKAIGDYAQLANTLESIDAVKHFSFRIYSPALAYSDEGNQPAQVKGIDLVREPDTTLILDKIQQGGYISAETNADGYYQAMIGTGIADGLEIGLGDELVVISQGADGSVANDIFIVGAIIGNKDSLERNQIILPLEAAQVFLSMYGQVHEAAITLDDFAAARNVAATLQAELPELTVSPWQVVEEDFYKSMQSDKQGNHTMMAIILFIVFIGVLNTVLMTVLERTREFGVLKAIGSEPHTIMLLVALETTLLAVLSIAGAFLLALPMVYWFANAGFSLSEPIDIGGIMFSAFKGDISFQVFFIPAVILLAFALVVSIPPGLRAARIPPTRAMSGH